MVTTNLRLHGPEPVELVDADEVRALIKQTDLRLSSLERRAAEANAIAEKAEARVRSEGIDEDAATWAIVRLQRFLDELRRESEHDAETMLSAARAGARTRVELARADQARGAHVMGPAFESEMRSDDAKPSLQTEVISRAEIDTVATEFAPSWAPAPATEDQRPPLVTDFPTVVARPMPAPVPPDSATSTNGELAHESNAEPAGWVDAPASEPSPNGATRTTEATPPPWEPEGPVLLAAPVAAPPVADPPRADSRVASAVDAEPRPASRRRRFPVSAVLEVIAVLLVLLFILLRLS